MPHIAALDQGTSSSRTLLFDGRANVVASAQREVACAFPRPGWVEQDAMALLETQLQTLREATDGHSVNAIGISNQRETTVVWDRRTGRPIAPAIVWQDRRTADACAAMAAADPDGAAAVTASTGLVLDAYFSATKIAWLLDHTEGARAAAEAGRLAFGTVDTWLVWNLTGGPRGGRHLTDASNASRTLLFDLSAGAWSDELCARFGVPPGLLPEVVDSAGDFGAVDHPALPALRGVPITGVLGDQQAATLGQVCTAPGGAKCTYGTGCFLLMNAGDKPPDAGGGLLGTCAWRLGGRDTYALEGSVFVGGSAVQYLRDQVGLIDDAAASEALAARVPDAGGVVVVPALTGLAAPHWDADARGAVFGLTRGTSPAHLARATLDGIAHQVADVLEALDHACAAPLAELAVDGGAARNDLLMQTQADLAQVPVVRPAQLETSALGAAFITGLGAGIWSGLDELRAHRQVGRRFEPQMSADAAAHQRVRWAEAVRLTRAWGSR